MLARTVPLPAERGRRSTRRSAACSRRRCGRPDDVPAFDNSAMDGFAVRAADTAAGARLRVVDESRAGAPGAPALARRRGDRDLDRRCDSRTAPTRSCRSRTRGHAGGELELLAAVERGRDVRRAGDDVRAGAAVLVAGPAPRPGRARRARIARPLDRARRPRPRAAVVTTGDELVGVDEPLPFGGVRNSGAYVMPALVERVRRRDGVGRARARRSGAGPRRDRRGARRRRRHA